MMNNLTTKRTMLRDFMPMWAYSLIETLSWIPHFFQVLF